MAAPLSFQEDVKPLFKEHCLNCHNPDKKKADLDLSTYAGIIAGSSSGEIVKAGVPDTSVLYQVMNHHDEVEPMPPKKPKLAAEQLKIVHSWIADGLIESSGGKSMLREVNFDLSAGSAARPENPAIPTGLPEVAPAKTNAPPPVIAMASSPWADVVATNGHEQVFLFGKNPDGVEFEHTGTLPFPEGTIHDLRFSQNGDLLIAAGGVGAASGKVVIYDVKTGKRQAVIGDEQDIVLSADISADHQYVAIGTPNKLVKIFSARDGKLLHRIKKHTDWVTVVRFSPDGKLLATGDRNGGIHVWETANAAIAFSLDEHKVKVNALAWRSDGQMLASAGEDGKFVLWDMKDGWPTRTATAHEGKAASRYTRRTGILDVAFSRNGRLLTTGRDRSLKLWQTDGTELARVSELEALPTRAAFGLEGDLAFTGDLSGNLNVWDLSTGSLKQTLRP